MDFFNGFSQKKQESPKTSLDHVFSSLGLDNFNAGSLEKLKELVRDGQIISGEGIDKDKIKIALEILDSQISNILHGNQLYGKNKSALYLILSADLKRNTESLDNLPAETEVSATEPQTVTKENPLVNHNGDNFLALDRNMVTLLKDGLKFPIENNTVAILGRQALPTNNTIAIPSCSNQTSSTHLRLRLSNSPEEIYIADLESTNGTYINAENKYLKVETETLIKSGTVLGIGGLEYIVIRSGNEIIFQLQSSYKESSDATRSDSKRNAIGPISSLGREGDGRDKLLKIMRGIPDISNHNDNELITIANSLGISRNHLIFRTNSEGKFEVVPSPSPLGTTTTDTKVNDQPISEPTVINNGDLIGLGKLNVRLKIENGEIILIPESINSSINLDVPLDNSITLIPIVKLPWRISVISKNINGDEIKKILGDITIEDEQSGSLNLRGNTITIINGEETILRPIYDQDNPIKVRFSWSIIGRSYRIAIQEILES